MEVVDDTLAIAPLIEQGRICESALELAEAPEEGDPIDLVIDRGHGSGIQQIKRKVESDKGMTGKAGAIMRTQLGEHLATTKSEVLPHPLREHRTWHEYHVDPEEPHEPIAISSLKLPPSFQ
jgi:hypothetical protein